MNRIFGKAKAQTSAAPAYTLEDASKSMTTRTESVEQKLAKLDAELLGYKQQLSKMKAGPAKTQVQQRALRVLKQKKMYDKQRSTLNNQQFNVDQTQFAVSNVRDTVQLVGAMKDAHKSLKTEMKAIQIDDIEDLHDDMSELLEDADEINEVVGRSFSVNEDVDEDDLMAELESMEGELELEEASSATEKEATPSYLVNAASAAKNPALQQKSTVQQRPNEAKQQDELDVDEFGLPSVPVRNLA